MKIIASSVFLLLVTKAAWASHVINADSNAEIVTLKKICTLNNTIIKNCFDDSVSLTGWIRDVRRPNENLPLVVNIGAGEFSELRMKCNDSTSYTGYISFNGSGRTVTKINGVGGVPIRSKNCTNLSFSNMSITSLNYILWSGGGESRWNNVDVLTGGNGWRESGCATKRGQHYWTSSRFRIGRVPNGNGYTALCDETWFFGSEVSTTEDSGSSDQSLIRADGVGIIHVYGGVLRALNFKTKMTIAKAENGGEIHIHGTGIDMITDSDTTAQALSAISGGTIHANSAAFNLRTGINGTVIRINENGGVVHAPYQWQPLIDPPNIISKNGADLAIETDCSNATCDDTGSHPHLLIYDESCTLNGPWNDVVTGKCRGQ